MNDNDFEHYLQSQANKHRLYASNNVWANIHQHFHDDKKWPALSIVAFCLIALLTVSTLVYNHPTKINFATTIVPANKNIPVNYKNSATTTTAKNTILVKVATHNSTIAENYTASNENDFQQIIAPYSNTNIAANNYNNISYEPSFKEYVVAIQSNHKIRPSTTTKQFDNEIKKRLIANNNTSIVATTGTNNNQTTTSIASVTAENKVVASTNAKPSTKKDVISMADENPTADDYIKANGFQLPISFKPKKKTSKWMVNVYAAPSISYRKLVDDKVRNNYQPTSVAAFSPQSVISNLDVNDVVRHKSAIGTEIGLGLMYKLGNRTRIRTGVQFNIRQYYIDSYKSGLSVANIAIIRNNRLDTINQFASISTISGYAETQLDNKLYQISVPIGLEWDALQGKHLGITIGGSIQPTLTLNQNVFILSTDYKYYTDGTPFFRKWNFNSSADVNFTYKTGKYKLYLGPQIRYQHLPTYSDKYPIKEFRLDYGLRLGITKQL